MIVRELKLRLNTKQEAMLNDWLWNLQGVLGQTKKFGKSVGDAGISQLRNMLAYKSCSNGRKFTLVDSKYTTMTCNECGARNGPSGFTGLSVRTWQCSCGAVHDRDINAARVIAKSGAGLALVSNGGEI